MHWVTADHLEEICPACRKRHNQAWHSEFHHFIHYEVLRCDCGHKVFRRTPYTTSGYQP